MVAEEGQACIDYLGWFQCRNDGCRSLFLTEELRKSHEYACLQRRAGQTAASRDAPSAPTATLVAHLRAKYSQAFAITPAPLHPSLIERLAWDDPVSADEALLLAAKLMAGDKPSDE